MPYPGGGGGGAGAGGAGGGGYTSSSPALASIAPALAQLPQCAQGPAFGIVPKFLQGKCVSDMACACKENGFALILAVEGATAKSCSTADQQLTTTLLQRLCGNLVPSLNDYRGQELVGFYVFAITMAYLAVAMRFISQRISGARISVDDYLVIVALFFDSVVNFAQLYSVHFGAGRHAVMVTARQVAAFTKLSFTSQLAFAVSITAAKLSILYLYHRLFRTHRFTVIGIVLALFLVSWGIAFPLTVVFNCKPVNYFWDKSIPGGHCIDGRAMSYTLAAVSTSTDVVVWALPIPWLWGLQMGYGKRLGIIATFALGGFVCVAGIIRIVFLDRLVFTDITWSVIPLDIWINVESSIGIVCICLPRMQPLINVLIPARWRAFICGSQVGSTDSYTLTDQSNIRGRLRRIPSNATSNVELPKDRDLHPAPSHKDGFIGAHIRYGERSREHVDDILPAHDMNHPNDIERPQPAVFSI